LAKKAGQLIDSAPPPWATLTSRPRNSSNQIHEGVAEVRVLTEEIGQRRRARQHFRDQDVDSR